MALKAERESLYHKLMSLHETSYLSLLSIGQGVALSFLATAAYQNHQSYDATAWIMTASVFIAIVVVWHTYVLGVAAFSWIPGITDAFIPFMFFAIEISLCLTISVRLDVWFFSFGVLGLVAFFAFLNMYRKARRYEENKAVLQALGYLTPISQYYPLAVFPFGILFGVRVNVWPTWLMAAWLLCTLIALTGVVFLMTTFVRGFAEAQHRARLQGPLGPSAGIADIVSTLETRRR